MGIGTDPALIYLAILVAILFAVAIGYTIVRFKKMEKNPKEYEGSDPETHYRT